MQDKTVRMESKQIYKVPSTGKERDDLRKRIHAYVDSLSIIPPLSMDDLLRLSDNLIGMYDLDPETKGWMMVELNNAVWRETVASIPYDKRILLLPKCLSNSGKCRADVDELGLLCHRCNHCSIPDLQDKAEALGMMSIVAEGFTSVIGLIENRVVDTVIGVSCLESLEKAFPLLIGNAVPGMAIPLNSSGCKDTTVDYGYVEQVIGMQSEKPVHLLDYDLLKSTIKNWFSAENLKSAFTVATDQTSRAALEWISGDGKRWRPYLLTAVYQALKEETKEAIPEKVRSVAIAVECFHKASLVHDDIQDNDLLRYGKQTVNAQYGTSVAINVGDMLLGEGYRLLTQYGNMELIRVASEAHIALCKGQGMELAWSYSPQRLTMDFVLEIFCNKTVPAFEVSLLMGMICAEGDLSLRRILRDYSRALGISYQLQDDVADFDTDEPLTLRPSAVLAALCEQNADDSFVHSLLHTGDLKRFLNQPGNQARLQHALDEVKKLARHYYDQALESLNELTNVELKRLLFRVTKRILK